MVIGKGMIKPSQRQDFINYLLTTQAKNVQLKRLISLSRCVLNRR
jgi:hypothetical protein